MMTSSDIPLPKKRRFWRWLAILLVLLAVLYSAGWFIAAPKVGQRVDAELARLAQKGVVADCVNRNVTGFPLGMAVTCDEVDYTDDGRKIYFNLDGLEAGVRLWQPFKVRAVLDAPFHLESPDFPPLDIEWDSMTAQVQAARPLPDSIALESRGLSAQTDPDDETEPMPLFEVASTSAVLRPAGADLAWSGRFDGLKIDPATVKGRTIPPLAGQGEATITGGVALLRDRPKSLRGQAVDIKQLTLSSGEGSVTVTGPASVDQDGLLNADLRIAVTNPKALSETLQTAIPERKREIKAAFTALSFMGSSGIPLKIVKGNVTLMGFTLTEVPALK